MPSVNAGINAGNYAGVGLSRWRLGWHYAGIYAGIGQMWGAQARFVAINGYQYGYADTCAMRRYRGWFVAPKEEIGNQD